MCTIDKYRNMYERMKRMTPDDTLEIILTSNDPSEKEFFEMVTDFFLQKKQAEVIKACVF